MYSLRCWFQRSPRFARPRTGSYVCRAICMITRCDAHTFFPVLLPGSFAVLPFFAGACTETQQHTNPGRKPSYQYQVFLYCNAQRCLINNPISAHRRAIWWQSNAQRRKATPPPETASYSAHVSVIRGIVSYIRYQVPGTAAVYRGTEVQYSVRTVV